MSQYRVCILKDQSKELIRFMKFDNKEDAEHYAKNQSIENSHYYYEIQKNNKNEFTTIKAYAQGQEKNLI